MISHHLRHSTRRASLYCNALVLGLVSRGSTSCGRTGTVNSRCSSHGILRRQLHLHHHNHSPSSFGASHLKSQKKAAAARCSGIVGLIGGLLLHRGTSQDPARSLHGQAAASSAASPSSSAPDGAAPLFSSALIEATDLEAALSSPNVAIVDASWHMPASKRKGFEEYQKGPRVPGAVFFDIDKACDMESDLPHMLPSAEEFSDYVTKLGISNSDSIVIYDTSGIFSAPRVWWMFTYFGHDNVHVLNGGLPGWRAKGMATDNSSTCNEAGGKRGAPDLLPFQAKERKEMLVSIEQLQRILQEEGGAAAVLDARSKGRFSGKEADPRGVRPGHMPGASNVPFGELLDGDGMMLPPTDLKAKLQPFNPEAGVVTTCGSGVTACIISLALHQAGYREARHQRVYDGAWAEWGGADDGYPVVKE